MRLFRSFIFALLVVSVPLAEPLFGQTGSGTIVGTVQDSGGAALIGGKVVVQPTGRAVATDNQGEFRIANLPAGQYTLTASYVGFEALTNTVTVSAGQTATANVTLKVGSGADSVIVTAPRLQGDAEAINVERMSGEIVQVEPMGVIQSLPNTNVADAIGRLPSVSLERDEGEGKYVQIRGTEPRLNNLTINGVNVPSVEVTVRNVKMDAIPSNGIERIEVYKTLSADQDADGIGGTVNLVTPTAQDKPTYSLNGTSGYNPLQNGFWRGGFDGTFGKRFGATKNFGFLLGGDWDRTNRGIDDLEPSQTTGQLADGTNVAYVSSEDFRSYNYYRTRYGFDLGIDDKITPTMTVYLKGLYADFHDFGETHVYTPSAGALTGTSSGLLTFDNTGSWAYREYIRRPDQQEFSVLTGARHDLTKDLITYDVAVSRGHNIGGQSFPTISFAGPSAVTFTENLSDPYRPNLAATDGTNGFDASTYGVTKATRFRYHATQLNVQGSANLAHSYTVHAHPSTLSVGLKIRNSYSTQTQASEDLVATNASPFTLASVTGNYTNPTYYNKSFAIGNQAYGPTLTFANGVNAIAANSGAFTAADTTATDANAFFNTEERISAGYIEDVIFFGNFRLQGGLRFDNGATHFLANQIALDANGNPTISPIRKDASYFNVLPTVALQYQVQKDTNLRAVYGRGLARPNVVDITPSVTIDPNQTPYPTVATGNPNLVPTKGNSYDLLVEHFFQPLGILQAGYFYKQLSDPIYPTATLINNYNGTGKTYQLTQSINGPSAHLQGFEAQYEQRFSFLPGLLNGFGINVNYSHTVSQVRFPATFDGGRTDKPSLDRNSPNDYNFNLTYDKSRFSGRFAISHNDSSIATYQWNAGNGPINDPILGLKGPTGDNYFYPHTQFDAQGSYRIYKGIQGVASLLNMSNEVFGFYNGSKAYPVQREYYRPTYSFGLRWTLASEK